MCKLSVYFSNLNLCRRCFFIQTHDWWNKFIYLSIIFMSILIFFEPPSSAAITVCHHSLFNYNNTGTICSDKEIIKDWEAWTIFVEFLLIMVSPRDGYIIYLLIFKVQGSQKQFNSLNCWDYGIFTSYKEVV